MFIYSVRASTIKFFSVIALTLAVLVGVLTFGGEADAVTVASSGIRLSEITTNEERIAFISQFGITVENEVFETEKLRIPEKLDKIMSEYNVIQKKQGLDLTKYKNKKVTRYTYSAPDYGGRAAFVNLVIYKGTVIACDVSATEPDGFVEPLIKI